jgi:putative transposase
VPLSTIMTEFTFQPFNPVTGPGVYRRNLPHWRQSGVTYFVTFRLADALPVEVLRALEQERDEWLVTHGYTSLEHFRQSAEECDQWEYAKEFNSRWHSLLDSGHGSCVLREKEPRDFVITALRHWHGDRLYLDEVVVMPNHVHALISPAPEQPLEKLLHSIKRFSARQINTLLGRKGSLWQDESFDHIVRSELQLEKFREYIRQNPARAGLKAGEYWVGSGDGGLA